VLGSFGAFFRLLLEITVEEKKLFSETVIFLFARRKRIVLQNCPNGSLLSSVAPLVWSCVSSIVLSTYRIIVSQVKLHLVLVELEEDSLSSYSICQNR
jgi:hypothetical protein